MVELRNLTGRAIHVGHVVSISCFYHQYLQHKFWNKELHTLIWKNKINYIWQQNMSPTKLEVIGSTSGLNNSHTYPVAATNQPLNDILGQDNPRILYGYTKLVQTADMFNSSPVINIDVYYNVWTRAPVSARALCRQRLHEKNPCRLDLEIGGTQTQGCLLVLARI